MFFVFIFFLLFCCFCFPFWNFSCRTHSTSSIHTVQYFRAIWLYRMYVHICIQYSKYKIFTVLTVLSLRFSLISFEFIAYLFILLIVIGLFVLHTPTIRKELRRIYFFPSYFTLEIVDLCIFLVLRLCCADVRCTNIPLCNIQKETLLLVEWLDGFGIWKCVASMDDRV